MQGNPILNSRRNNSNNIPQQTQFQQLPIQETKQLMKQMQMLGNPNLILATLAQQRPEVNAILALTKKGNSLQQIAEVMAQQKNINLDELRRELQS